MRFPVRYQFVVGTFFLSLLLYIDRACISVAKGPIAESLSLSDRQMGWVMSVFALGYALAQTPSGALADKLGPRRVLAAVVAFWSLFTALTGAAFNLVSLLIARFIFGVGEAGAFPGMARAVFSWIPVKERGVVTGINFSGSRLGAAFALPLVAWLINAVGWRGAFVTLGVLGVGWSVVWYLWFRDQPADHPYISKEEVEYIESTRQKPGSNPTPLTVGALWSSRELRLAAAQYFCSNFTFFFCLSWLFPYLKETYELDTMAAGYYAAAPLVFGALGNYVSGLSVDYLYRTKGLTLSRRVPAIIGFALAAIGLLGSLHMSTALGAVVFLSLAIFGADMTLSPSWSFCVDIGGRHAGAVSGTMNMAGNIGSFLTALAFPYLKAWTQSTDPFFYAGVVLNVIAIVIWLKMRPDNKAFD